VLTVRGLSKVFEIRGKGFLKRVVGSVRAVDELSFDVASLRQDFAGGVPSARRNVFSCVEFYRCHHGYCGSLDQVNSNTTALREFRRIGERRRPRTPGIDNLWVFHPLAFIRCRLREFLD
jgi:hypothetical protein